MTASSPTMTWGSVIAPRFLYNVPMEDRLVIHYATTQEPAKKPDRSIHVILALLMFFVLLAVITLAVLSPLIAFANSDR
jgi:hypothetical protein